MSTEADGIRARLALVERYVDVASRELKSADAEHWRHLREHELFDLLRQRDRLTAQLELVTRQDRKTKNR